MKDKDDQTSFLDSSSKLGGDTWVAFQTEIQRKNIFFKLSFYPTKSFQPNKTSMTLLPFFHDCLVALSISLFKNRNVISKGSLFDEFIGYITHSWMQTVVGTRYYLKVKTI